MFWYTGQREEASFGLYYYGARWEVYPERPFDILRKLRTGAQGSPYAKRRNPALGRFIQADTIVPGGVQGLDRYAYVSNNPVRYNDPSGHGPAVTNMLYTDDIFPSPPSPSTPSDYYIEAMIAYKYHITFIGDWRNLERRDLYGSLENLNATYTGITLLTAGSVFKYVRNTDHFGKAEGGNITFWGGTNGNRLEYKVYYHEIGHAINNKAGGYFVNALTANAIYTSKGEYVMGGPSNPPKDPYHRNSLGYQEEILDPTGNVIAPQQHAGDYPCGSRDGWCSDGNTPSE